ncbi:MAG: Uma2 family endonuclease [Eubacterium sp.]|nr:Uma2 family endonuclease [Eubacterium sp.]
MKISEIIERKKELGYSVKKLSVLSGVPVGTIQKIMNGETKSPRHETIEALSKVLKDTDDYTYKMDNDVFELRETLAYYAAKRYENDKKLHTLEEYLALPEGTRIEMIDGRFYKMAAPNIDHQDITGRIYYAFLTHILRNNGPCKTFISPIDVQLFNDDKTIVQPDIVIVCNKDNITHARIVGAPDLIVEILSPSNFLMDTSLKFAKYKMAGVREYWIVDPNNKKVLVYLFDENDLEPEMYEFDDEVPVGIWNGECKVRLSELI